MTELCEEGVDTVCMVCCKICTCVARELDDSSFWFQDILKDRLGETYQLVQTLCDLCDKLVSEYEQASREQRSIREEIESRFSGTCEDVEVSEDVDLTTGEIKDISNYMKNGVKIFEINVKSEELIVDNPAEVNENDELLCAQSIQLEDEELQHLKNSNQNSSGKFEASDKTEYELEEAELALAKICKFCLDNFQEIDTFKEHVDFNHQNDDSPFLCLICKKTFHSLESRFKHFIKSHREIKCDRCSKKFSSDTKLNIHMRQCTYGEVHKCKDCDKTFANKRNLRDHRIYIHDSGDAGKLSANYHYPCSECNKVFYKKSNLTSHLLRHSNEKPFVCGVTQCGKSFKREKTLLKHFQVIHEGVKDQFLCVHCGQQFLSTSGLKGHLSVHTGQSSVKREIACPECPKMFRCSADLQAHSVVHSKVKAFSCSLCHQTFSQKASLKDHENVHLNRFQCDACGKSFGRDRYLKLHMKTCNKLHHGKQVREDHMERTNSVVSQEVCISERVGVEEEKLRPLSEVKNQDQMRVLGEVKQEHLRMLGEGLAVLVEGQQPVIQLISNSRVGGVRLVRREEQVVHIMSEEEETTFEITTDD